jgi:hypothetical protein
LVKVEAKIIFRDECVYLVKHCPTHGHQEVLIADDIDYYKKSLEFIKPGDMPLKFNTPIKYGCPYDCGLCPDVVYQCYLYPKELAMKTYFG